MKDYYIHKVIEGGGLEYMGKYTGKNKQDAIQRMARSGNLTGGEWTALYVASHKAFKAYKIKE